MRLETKFTVCIAAALTIMLGLGVSLAPNALGQVTAWGPECVIVSAVVAYLCARRFVCVPAEGLAAKMSQIADAREYDKPLDAEAGRPDSLALPARAFNRMLASSSSMVTALKTEKSELEARITALEAELTSVRTDLRSAQERCAGSEKSISDSEEKAQAVRQQLECLTASTQVSAERNSFVLKACPAPIFTMDTEGTVRTWNAAAQRLFGWSEAECVGRPPVIVPTEEDGNDDLVGQLLDGKSFSGIRAVAEKKDGSAVNVTLEVAPAKDASEKVCELVVVVSGEVVGAAIAECSNTDASETSVEANVDQATAPVTSETDNAAEATQTAEMSGLAGEVVASEVVAEVVATVVADEAAAAVSCENETAGTPEVETPAVAEIQEQSQGIVCEVPGSPMCGASDETVCGAVIVAAVEATSAAHSNDAACDAASAIDAEESDEVAVKSNGSESSETSDSEEGELLLGIDDDAEAASGRPVMKLCTDHGDDCRGRASGCETTAAKGAKAASGFPRAAAWSPEEESGSDTSRSHSSAAAKSQSKSRRAPASRATTKAKKAVKPQRAKARVTTAKRHRQVA